MANDPVSQAKRAQEAAAEARAAAKAAAVAQAKAEARAESAAQPNVVNTAAVNETNVPLDVFTRSSNTTAAQKSDAGARDLSQDQERMAEASGAGRSGALTPGKPGESTDPDFSSIGRPHGRQGPDALSTAESPFGDRESAMRGTSPAAENPLDNFGKLDTGADRLREATGRDGGLEGAAARFSPFAENPATPENPGFGKSSVAAEGDLVLAAGIEALAAGAVAGAALAAGAPAVAAVALGAGVFAVGAGAGAAVTGTAVGDAMVIDSLVDTAVQFTELNSAEEIQANIEFNKAARAHADQEAAAAAKPPPASSTNTDTSTMPLTDIVTGQPVAGGGVKDPGSPDLDPTTGGTKLPPGFIDGDLLLPPSLRTGANVGGAKGNDGTDWAHSRLAATNPSREDTGGGGGKETYIQRAGKNSLISQPEPDDGAGGGGVNGTPTSGTPQNLGGSTDPLDGSAWTGPTRTEEPGDLNMTSSEGALAGVWSKDDDDDGWGRD